MKAFGKFRSYTIINLSSEFVKHKGTLNWKALSSIRCKMVLSSVMPVSKASIGESLEG